MSGKSFTAKKRRGALCISSFFSHIFLSVPFPPLFAFASLENGICFLFFKVKINSAGGCSSTDMLSPFTAAVSSTGSSSTPAGITSGIRPALPAISLPASFPSPFSPAGALLFQLQPPSLHLPAIQRTHHSAFRRLSLLYR